MKKDPLGKKRAIGFSVDDGVPAASPSGTRIDVSSNRRVVANGTDVRVTS